MSISLNLRVYGVMAMLIPACSPAIAGSMSMDGLLTEYLQRPVGIDEPRPGFSWRLKAAKRGIRQTGYQVQVASSEKLLAAGKPDMWDSGKVESAQCVNVTYAGKDLQSRTAYYWRVRIWDQGDCPREWSKPAIFETAYLDQSEWTAQWITPQARGQGNGYHSDFGASADSAKWVQIDLGENRAFRSIVLYPARPYNWKHDVPGFGFPVRYKIEVSDDPCLGEAKLVADRTLEDEPNPGLNPVAIDVGEHSGRYVRLTATRLHVPQDTRPLLALAEMEVLNAAGENLALGAPVNALDSIDDSGWAKTRLTNGGRVSCEERPISPLMRREFALDKPVARARAYVTGLGYYELTLNGRRVGDRVLDPACTAFGKRVYYSTYDVTGMLKRGANCVGAMLGQGWWSSTPRLRAQIEVTFTDGSETRVSTDGEWRWSDGPMIENSLYHGETYDARLEQRGWNTAGFDSSAWKPVDVVTAPASPLAAQTIQPIKVIDTFVPKSINSPKPGVYVYDFGQNFSGWCRLSVSGPEGTKVTLRHAELIYPDGTINPENLRAARATDTYILCGKDKEVYEPRFTYHGFRYVQMEGYPGTPPPDAVRGCVVHTAFEFRGEFECSNDLLNQVTDCADWGQRTNFHSIPTDCPQRDERQGWMGDAHMAANAMLYVFDMPPAYSKFLLDIRDSQREDGAVPDTVPHIWGSQPGDPMWAAAYPLIAWQTFVHTGDRRLLERHYDGIRRYVEMLRREADGFIITRNHYGDWIGVVETPKDLISTGAFHLVTGVLVNMAEVLGRDDDARDYRDLCGQIAAAFHARFFDPNTGNYGNASQMSNAFPLYLEIVPQELRQRVFDNLANDIVKNHSSHLSTGFIGTPYLMSVLTREGRADLAYTIATQRTYPGWGYMVENGATTIWELWKLETGPGMNSHNHPALGFVTAWFYGVLTGITPDAKQPGWEHFAVKPHVVGDLEAASAAVDTVRGEVGSNWALTSRGIDLSVAVPPGSRAAVFVPKAGKARFDIREGRKLVWRSGKYISGAQGITGGEDAGDWVMFEVGSGRYSFKLTSTD